MKTPTNEAAADLGIHPANLVLYVADTGLSFDDIWPEIESDWIEAVRAQHWDRFGPKAASALPAGAAVSSGKTPSASDLSPGAKRVVEKLWRNKRWGAADVSIEQLQKHTRLSGEPLRVAIRELEKLGILLAGGATGPYSLNPSRRAEIDRIAAASCSGR